MCTLALVHGQFAPKLVPTVILLDIILFGLKVESMERGQPCRFPRGSRTRPADSCPAVHQVPTEVLLIEQRPQTKKRMSVMTCDGLRSAAGAATTEAGEKAVAERQGPPADLPRGEYLPTGQNVMTHGHCGVASSCRWARRAAAWLRLKRSTMAGMPPVAAQATAGFSAWASWELASSARNLAQARRQV